MNVILLHLPAKAYRGWSFMGLFRSQRRSWAWVALLALALQLGLSFGHVHGIATAGSVAALAASAAPSETGDHSDDYCATCAVLALLTGGQTATAPVVVPPLALASADITIALQTARTGTPRAAFNSRAPPRS
jgi:hypothetical protein